MSRAPTSSTRRGFTRRQLSTISKPSHPAADTGAKPPAESSKGPLVNDRPRLRMLEAFPVEEDGQRLVALRDPAGFTDQILVFPPALLDLVSLFDGEHSVSEIQAILRTRHGEAPTAEQIGGLIEGLDEAGFLASE